MQGMSDFIKVAHDSKADQAEKVEIFDDQFLHTSSSQLDFHPSLTW